jgi:hypothetical protein
VAEVQREVPEIDLGQNKGQLTFPTPRSILWRIALPDVTLGQRKPAAEESLKKVLLAYLNSAGGQALESVPANERAGLLEALKNSASVQIDDKPASPSSVPGPVVTPTKGLPSAQASSQSGAMGSNPVGAKSAWTQRDFESEMNRGLESYWAGDTASALERFRTITTRQPDQSPAWYFQALCQQAMGDQGGAEWSLRQAARNEALTNSTREVSQALVRVQGPTRNWIEATRRVLLAENTRS